MKIDNSVKQTGGNATVSRRDGARTPPPTQASEQGADVALSPLSSRLQEIESSLATSPAIDSERIAEIRQAISQGTFKIDASKIADGLLDNVRQMLDRQK